MRSYDGPRLDPWDDDGWVANVADPDYDAWSDEQQIGDDVEWSLSTR